MAHIGFYPREIQCSWKRENGGLFYEVLMCAPIAAGQTRMLLAELCLCQRVPKAPTSNMLLVAALVCGRLTRLWQAHWQPAPRHVRSATQPEFDKTRPAMAGRCKAMSLLMPCHSHTCTSATLSLAICLPPLASGAQGFLQVCNVCLLVPAGTWAER